MEALWLRKQFFKPLESSNPGFLEQLLVDFGTYQPFTFSGREYWIHDRRQRTACLLGPNTLRCDARLDRLLFMTRLRPCT
jgi:hypothetical protein